MPDSSPLPRRALVRIVIVALLLAALLAVALVSQGRRLEANARPQPAPAPVYRGPSAPSLRVQLIRAVQAARASDAWYAAAAAVPRETSPAAPVAAPVAPDPGPEPSFGPGQRVHSTAYCLTGTMADGQPARRGAVAGNLWPLGTRLRVSDSPGVGEVVTVEDRIGSGSQLDFALPGDCAGARAWGSRSVTVEVLGDG